MPTNKLWRADIRTGCVAVYPADEEHQCLDGCSDTAIMFQMGRGQCEDFSGNSYRSVTDEQAGNALLIAEAPAMLALLNRINQEGFSKALENEVERFVKKMGRI
jgi:hypothetical protein